MCYSIFISDTENRPLCYQLLVVASFTENAVDFKAPDGIDLSKGELVLTNYNDSTLNGNGFKTKPYETRVYLFK